MIGNNQKERCLWRRYNSQYFYSSQSGPRSKSMDPLDSSGKPVLEYLWSFIKPGTLVKLQIPIFYIWAGWGPRCCISKNVPGKPASTNLYVTFCVAIFRRGHPIMVCPSNHVKKKKLNDMVKANNGFPFHSPVIECIKFWLHRMHIKCLMDLNMWSDFSTNKKK